ncbi:MAG: hypothetical protein A2381_12835 [Bdellovibrionales bacterium RIFOXYB1_FULL_37_110]|nr:MAG: hypothetical protein A2181_02160 [Bdellovibrionales bacterium RIFOXYA1_FULL_38_20]OFZ51592.1 MAG: hypothetical protein A2417_12495 [Bdellovibrionales bacterium RIFOXYC1_FULL_37_79]OFZ60419.1 MAG: hypothetical protein A2381_12835 [Bdellovibrionales bacterium RIFOXYB1_FULL_37_110]OFZ64992.1 MAG: hypothetical protein A2577_09100 [Bdellovibrionales bacterium RIFOXYD1_FULL_36_51]
MKTTTIILLSLGLALLSSCGSKKNTVNSLSNPYSTLSSGLTSQQASDIENLKNMYRCSGQYAQNAQRIADVTFSSNTPIGSGGVLPAGALQLGGYASGSVTGVYAGVSAYNDIIVVKTLSGGGFTVSLSFCTYQYWISAGATVTNFMLQSGKITTPNACSYGGVIANNTIAQISSAQAQIPTSFGPVSCQNGQYNNYNNWY